jgi:hypothetical protein
LRADGNTELLIELAYNYRYISLICILWTIFIIK